MEEKAMAWLFHVPKTTDRYTKLIRLELEDEMESKQERLENGAEVVWLRMESPCLI